MAERVKRYGLTRPVENRLRRAEEKQQEAQA
jgi:hypothetical protein